MSKLEELEAFKFIERPGYLQKPLPSQILASMGRKPWFTGWKTRYVLGKFHSSDN